MSSFEVELSEILQGYSNQVSKELEDLAQETAKETVAKLRETSPKKTGKYSKGWKVSETKIGPRKSFIIHNKDGQLTHLLENGHSLKNGGRTKEFKHIEPALKFASDLFEQKVKTKLGK